MTSQEANQEGHEESSRNCRSVWLSSLETVLHQGKNAWVMGQKPSNFYNCNPKRPLSNHSPIGQCKKMGQRVATNNETELFVFLRFRLTSLRQLSNSHCASVEASFELCIRADALVSNCQSHPVQETVNHQKRRLDCDTNHETENLPHKNCWVLVSEQHTAF